MGSAYDFEKVWQPLVYADAIAPLLVQEPVSVLKIFNFSKSNNEHVAGIRELLWLEGRQESDLI